MFAFKFEVCTKECPCEKKLFDRQTVISMNQLLIVHEHMYTCSQPLLPLINGLVDDALLELSSDRN